MIAHLEAGHPLAQLDHDARALMAEDGGKDPLGVAARAGELVGVTQPRGLDLHQNLARLRAVKLHIHDLERLPGLHRDGSTCAHATSFLVSVCAIRFPVNRAS